MVDLSTPKAAASATWVMPGLARIRVSTPNEPGVKSRSAERRLELGEDLGLRAPHLIADVGRQLVEIELPLAASSAPSAARALALCMPSDLRHRLSYRGSSAVSSHPRLR